MKVAVVADSHFDTRARFDECVRVHEWIADDMEDREVDLVLHAGDLYERKSNQWEREAAAAWVQRCAMFAPFLIVRGNHDAVDDLPLLERLQAECPIHVVQDARMVLLTSPRSGESLAVACMAWPRASEFRQHFPDREPTETLQAVFRHLGQQLESFGAGGLFLGHCMIRGSRVSTGQPLVGCDFEIGLDDLGLVGAQAYVIGHVHRGQTFDIGGAPCVYPGSPRRKDFGELEPKGYLLLERDEPDAPWRGTFVATPARQMVHLEGHWRGPDHGLEVTGMENTSNVKGAEFRLRVHADRAELSAARDAAGLVKAQLLEAGAALVKVEDQVTVTRRTRAGVDQAITLAEQVQALWVARNEDPPRRDALLAKLHELETEARNAI